MTFSAETEHFLVFARSKTVHPYGWKRNRVFKFLSSVRLAVLLLTVLILACASGTIYESHFDARVARAWFYEARWFNAWLLFLGVNLACAALSRWPWKRHHAGFLITHLGIIVLLCGAFIGKLCGIEGIMTLKLGEPPKSFLVTDQEQLMVRDGASTARTYPIHIINRRPTLESPWNLGVTESGWRLELIDYANLKAVFHARPSPQGETAIRLLLESPRLGQKMEHWLMADHPQHSMIDLGIAKVELTRGTLPSPTTSSLVETKRQTRSLRFIVYAGEDLSYQLFTGQEEPLSGKLELNQPVATGWADWTATLLEVIPSASGYNDFLPQPDSENSPFPKGLKVRLSKEGRSIEHWVAGGWEIPILTSAASSIRIGYGLKLVPLPVGVQLERFTIQRNPGGNRPSSFKSDLSVHDIEGRSASGSCWMNHPMNFPEDWWRGWTGHTYKISQAAWDPKDAEQSTVQILRDPGWLFKWIGSLLICLGIYTLFYLRPYPIYRIRKT